MFNLTNVTSSDACIALAKELRAAADNLDIRARQIERERWSPDKSGWDMKALMRGFDALRATPGFPHVGATACRTISLRWGLPTSGFWLQAQEYQRRYIEAKRRDRDAEIVRQRRNRVPAKEVARRFGLHPSAVSHVVRRAERRELDQKNTPAVAGVRLRGLCAA